MNSSQTLPIPIARASTQKCAAQHFGAWSIEPKWFSNAIAAVRAGTWKPKAFDDSDDGDEGDDETGYVVRDGVAIICIDGQMTKRGSSFGGCSTVAVRQSIRQALGDYTVRALMLNICSPGGTVAGTADLAGDIRAARAKKPVYAFASDMCCSAAYWAASQCERIFCNVTAAIGCIGTMCVLEDDTAHQEQVGVKYRVVSTGDYKGLGADGKVSDKFVADVQRELDELNVPFLADVAQGRKGKIKDLAAVTDGRAYVGSFAIALGLADEVTTLEAALATVSQKAATIGTPAPTYAARAPVQSAPPKPPVHIDRPGASILSRDAATAQATAEWADNAGGCRATFATEPIFVAYRRAVLEGRHRVTGRAPSSAPVAKPTPAPLVAAKSYDDVPSTFLSINAATAQAKDEWNADLCNCKRVFVSEGTFVAYRRAVLEGRHRPSKRAPGVSSPKPAA